MNDDVRNEQIKEKARQYIRALRQSRDVRQRHLQITTVPDFVAHVNESIKPSETGKDLDASEYVAFSSYLSNPDRETREMQVAIAALSSGDMAISMAASNGPVHDVITVVRHHVRRVRESLGGLEAALDELQAYLDDLDGQR